MKSKKNILFIISLSSANVIEMALLVVHPLKFIANIPNKLDRNFAKHEHFVACHS